MDVYSPMQVVHHARHLGLSAGMSFDLSVLDQDDHWDFNDKNKVAKAMDVISISKPCLIIRCPPCAAFSVLFASNIPRTRPE